MKFGFCPKRQAPGQSRCRPATQVPEPSGIGGEGGCFPEPVTNVRRAAVHRCIGRLDNRKDQLVDQRRSNAWPVTGLSALGRSAAERLVFSQPRDIATSQANCFMFFNGTCAIRCSSATQDGEV